MMRNGAGAGKHYACTFPTLVIKQLCWNGSWWFIVSNVAYCWFDESDLFSSTRRRKCQLRHKEVMSWYSGQTCYCSFVNWFICPCTCLKTMGSSTYYLARHWQLLKDERFTSRKPNYLRTNALRIFISYLKFLKMQQTCLKNHPNNSFVKHQHTLTVCMQ